MFQISVSKSADGNVSSQLSIASVSWSDGGVYSCVAKEVGGEEGAETPTKQNILLDILGKKTLAKIFNKLKKETYRRNIFEAINTGFNYSRAKEPLH